MYQYTFSNEDTNKLTDKTKNYSDMLNKFSSVDKQFSYSSEPLNLQKKEFDKKSTEEIENQAKTDLKDFKENNIKEINDKFSLKQDGISKEIEDSKLDGIAKKQETQNLYSNLKEKASNDAIKRGLSRSSIVINILDAFDKNMIQEYNKINDEISKKVELLNGQKELLNEQQQNALNSFDISYAVKLNDKIEDINKALMEEEQKVLEYNNKIIEKEAEYEAKRKKEALDYANYIKENGEDAVIKLKQQQKFDYAKNYLDSLTKEEALNELANNKIYGSELGPANFTKLKLYFMGKK